jgi:hypothetical protein
VPWRADAGMRVIAAEPGRHVRRKTGLARSGYGRARLSIRRRPRLNDGRVLATAGLNDHMEARFGHNKGSSCN